MVTEHGGYWVITEQGLVGDHGAQGVTGWSQNLGGYWVITEQGGYWVVTEHRGLLGDHGAQGVTG